MRALDEEEGGGVEVEVRYLCQRRFGEMVDVTVHGAKDEENIKFWEKGYGVVSFYTGYSSEAMRTPVLEYHIDTLDAMVHRYECPEVKAEKRARQLSLLRLMRRMSALPNSRVPFVRV